VCLRETGSSAQSIPEQPLLPWWNELTTLRTSSKPELNRIQSADKHFKHALFFFWQLSGHVPVIFSWKQKSCFPLVHLFRHVPFLSRVCLRPFWGNWFHITWLRLMGYCQQDTQAEAKITRIFPPYRMPCVLRSHWITPSRHKISNLCLRGVKILWWSYVAVSQEFAMGPLTVGWSSILVYVLQNVIAFTLSHTKQLKPLTLQV